MTTYGATEALPLAIIGTSEVLRDTALQTAHGKGTCVGTPFDGVDVRIIKVSDEPISTWSDALMVPTGEIGELVVGGSIVSPEYKDAPNANATAKILDGEQLLHRMGDLVTIDHLGRLWFCGRKAHRVETSRGMLPTVPVENVFNEHDMVFRTALVGVDAKGRQIPVLCVEMRKGERWSDKVEMGLRELFASTRWKGWVERFLPHRVPYRCSTQL